MRSTHAAEAVAEVGSLGDFARHEQHHTPATQRMFSNMRAQTKWDIGGDMLWGYFFTNHDPMRLEPLAEHLARSGYRVVSIY